MRPRLDSVVRPWLWLLVFAPLGVLPLTSGDADARPERTAASPRLVVVPFALDAARRPGVVAAQLFIANPRPVDERCELLRFRLSADGLPLYEQALAHTLPGGPDFAELVEWIERLPPELTHRHGPRAFAPADAPEYPAARWSDRITAVRKRLADLRSRYRLPGAERPFVSHDFWLPLDQLVTASDAARTLSFELELDLRFADGPVTTWRGGHELRWLGAPRPLPQALASSGWSVHAGDLHVHSCHGEATNACAPSADCAAESFQTSGSFTYAQLKSQYQALGLDWFTATDHSYCIDSDAEYAQIVTEVDALDEPGFAVLPDLEVSNDEIGPQIGSDVGDTTCLFTTSANHLGAHGIQARIPGGDDAFLGFCDGLFGDALEDFEINVASVRAMGGFGIANHPTGSFGWNSFDATDGLEAQELHGVEIWNGAFVSGQGGDVGQWVDWLRAGRVLYAYSGSDTHDAAFAFGANHVLLSEPLSRASLVAALAAGRSYVSNGPLLVLEVDEGASTHAMGQVQALPAGGPDAPVTVRAFDDFGSATGTVTLFTGTVGAPAEAVVGTSGPLSGAGTYELDTQRSGSVASWFRAYATNTGLTEVAYSNPVFFRVASADPTVYCTAKTASGGCVPSLAWSGTPSATLATPFDVVATDVVNQKPGLAILALAPGAIPFQGATLCVTPPTQRGPITFSAGNPPPDDCSGALATDVNALIQSGFSPILTSGTTIHTQVWFRDPQDGTGFGTGLSNALRFTIQP